MNKQKLKKVFIVDDHPVMREGLKQFIEDEKDLKVCGAGEDIEGSLLAIKKNTPHIVIVDLTLKDGSGMRVIEGIHSLYPDIIMLVYSMHEESIYAERCLKAGAKGYIMKQEPPEKVILALRNVLEGNVYLSNSLKEMLVDRSIKSKLKDDKNSVEILSKRELEVYQLIGRGFKKAALSEQLNLSNKTIETYIENIKKKMRFNSLHEMIIHSVKFHCENIR